MTTTMYITGNDIDDDDDDEHVTRAVERGSTHGVMEIGSFCPNDDEILVPDNGLYLFFDIIS